MGGGGSLANADVIRGGRSMLTGRRVDKICQNIADVICERSLGIKIYNSLQNYQYKRIYIVFKSDCSSIKTYNITTHS